MASSQVGDGRQVVTTAGTRVQMTTQPVWSDSTCITALTANTGVIVVGGATVVASAGTQRGTPLAAGESVTFNCDATLLWLDATVNGDGVTFSFEAR